MKRFALLLVVASTIGPYLADGIRTDQVVVYGLAAIVLPFTVYGLRLSRAGGAVVAAWMLLVIAALSGLLGTVANTSGWVAGNPVANLDNLLLPVVALLLTLALVAGRDPDEVRQDVTLTASLAAAAAAAIGVVQFLQPVLVAPYLPLFIGSGDTAERALTLGRFTSVFGQPSIAGAFYTVGILCAVYAFRRRPVAQAAVIAIITAGGVLTVSKGFLLIGLPLAALLLLRSRGRTGQRLVGVAVAVGLYAAAVNLGLVATWSGWSRIVALLPGQGVDLMAYTGNRYGAESSTAPVIAAVLREHPLVGYGVSGLATPTDTLLVQALVLGGLLGAACALIVLGAILLGWRAGRSGWNANTSRFYGALAVALVALSLGSPALTGNRVSVVAWVLLALILGRAVPGSDQGGDSGALAGRVAGRDQHLRDDVARR